MKKQLLTALCLIMGFTGGGIFSTSIHAEYCDMVGGEGEIHWIHIPRSQYMYNEQNNITINGKTYPLDRNARLFKQDGLPNINALVELNVNVASVNLPECLIKNDCSDTEIKRWETIKHTDRFAPFNPTHSGSYQINQAPYSCLHSHGTRGCWDISQGSSLKILGYNYFEQILFALVAVKSC